MTKATCMICGREGPLTVPRRHYREKTLHLHWNALAGPQGTEWQKLWVHGQCRRKLYRSINGFTFRTHVQGWLRLLKGGA